MNFSNRLTLAMLCGALGACGPMRNVDGSTRHPSGSPDTTSDPNVVAAMQRESEGLTPHAVAAQGVRAKVVSAGDPKLRIEGGATKVMIPINAETDVQCILYEEDPDPGRTFVAIVENMKKEFEIRGLTPGPMVVIKEAPVTTLDVYYLVNTDGGPALGQLKLALHSRFGSSSLCMHDELGYQKTFAEVARSFFETYDRGNHGISTAYVEILAGEVNDQPAGHDRNLVFVHNGTRKLISTSLLLLQTGPLDIMAQDASSVITLDKHDRIEKGRWLESQNDTLALDIELERIKGNHYRYRGTRRGAAIQGEFSTKDPLGLPSSLWAQKELKSRLAKPAAFTLSLEQYRPDDDPAAVSLLEIARRLEDPPRAVRMKTRGIEAISLVDEHGRDKHSEVVVEGAKIVLDRAYERGKSR